MTYAFGKRSLDKMKGLHPDLVRVLNLAIKKTSQDFMVLEGVRTLARQKDLYAQGRTKPGPKVTWTLNSRHIPKSDGLGHAVDLVPFPVDWSTPAKFDAIYAAMLNAAAELGVGIRSGMDWDRDGKKREKGESDSPHFELT